MCLLDTSGHLPVLGLLWAGLSVALHIKYRSPGEKCDVSCMTSLYTRYVGSFVKQDCEGHENRSQRIPGSYEH